MFFLQHVTDNKNVVILVLKHWHRVSHILPIDLNEINWVIIWDSLETVIYIEWGLETNIGNSILLAHSTHQALKSTQILVSKNCTYLKLTQFSFPTIACCHIT